MTRAICCLANVLKEYIADLSLEELEALIEIPPPELQYIYAFPCFKLSKIQKIAPNSIAQELKEKIKLPEFIKSIDVAGPYVNFEINPNTIVENIFEFMTDYGRLRNILEKAEKPRIIVEYPSPNTNKPLHFGHIRKWVWELCD